MGENMCSIIIIRGYNNHNKHNEKTVYPSWCTINQSCAQFYLNKYWNKNLFLTIIIWIKYYLNNHLDEISFELRPTLSLIILLHSY